MSDTSYLKTLVETELLSLYGWLKHLQERRAEYGNPRWDWLRYLGLMPLRKGPGDHLYPSGTIWSLFGKDGWRIRARRQGTIT